MSAVQEFTIPGDDVIEHVAYDAYGDIPFGWHVFLLKDRDALRRLRSAANDYEILEHPEAYAWTNMHFEPDGGNYIGEMYFAADYVYVGLIAHEALHLASWMLRFPEGQWPVNGRHQKRVKRMTFGREPERFAEIVAQLTSVTWYNLEDHWSNDATFE